ncbi:S-adenosyl-L-homocysteine hydrolase [Aminobacter sp. Y103A]|uniref:NAD(P)-dependent oxidoreductase n=1 Tax=Aminobacter sp. Y103A TaxID=1870862 RepID=UPI002574670C|nr:NAD(P)-dependent oxidoreductase [Aminobacter sp. SS-2016]BBD39634.1 S-adenosyl-L-homocysteine hydrolase [Aminobacter sp. SS-2016]
MLNQITIHDGERAWQERLSTVFNRISGTMKGRSLSGAKIGVWKILSPNTAPLLEALMASGAEIVAGSSHPNAVSDPTVEYLRQRGAKVFAHNGMSMHDYKSYLAAAVAEKPDYVLSSGAALLLACKEQGWSPRAALEGTRTGTNRLDGEQMAFPIFDWNDSQLKNSIEHRFHVAESFWSAFAYLTGMSLFGRKILVVGFGPVGKGICERARNLGGHVLVADTSALRSAEAVFHGHQVTGLYDGVALADIVVTVTGRDGIIKPEHYAVARQGTVFVNAGHSARELSIDWINRQERSELRNRIDVFTVEGKQLLLLCSGDALNLASGAGPFGTDIWDIFNGLILRGAHWMHSEMPADSKPGVHPYPLHLQEEVARAFLDDRGFQFSAVANSEAGKQ